MGRNRVFSSKLGFSRAWRHLTNYAQLRFESLRPDVRLRVLVQSQITDVLQNSLS